MEELLKFADFWSVVWNKTMHIEFHIDDDLLRVAICADIKVCNFIFSFHALTIQHIGEGRMADGFENWEAKEEMQSFIDYYIHSRNVSSAQMNISLSYTFLFLHIYCYSFMHNIKKKKMSRSNVFITSIYI